MCFFTIIPLGMDEKTLENTARYLHLSLLIGSIIGFLAGLMMTVLRPISRILAGILTLAFIEVITGFHHIDGLMDFADGLMCHGTPEDKIKCMHDKFVGVGGCVASFLVILATIASLIELNTPLIIHALIITETSAKLGIVYLATFGRSASRGMGKFFISTFQSSYKYSKFAFAVMYAICISLILLSWRGIIIPLITLGIAHIILLVSLRSFKAITGDVMGATNEIVRLVCLISMLVMTK